MWLIPVSKILNWCASCGWILTKSHENQINYLNEKSAFTFISENHFAPSLWQLIPISSLPFLFFQKCVYWTKIEGISHCRIFIIFLFFVFLFYSRKKSSALSPNKCSNKVIILLPSVFLVYWLSIFKASCTYLMELINFLIFLKILTILICFLLVSFLLFVFSKFLFF